VKATTASGAIVHTDGWQGYAGLSKLGYDHRPRSKRAAPPGEQLHGTHRWASHEHLPVYLDEYLYRHNRRATPMAAFQALLGLGALHEPTTYREITRKTA
jgi:hypothetical protein